MRIKGRSWLRVGLLVGLLLSSPAMLAAQQEQSDAEKELRRVVGNWTLNPIAEDAPVPTPPPIYASYRSKDDPPPPPLESIPRMLIEIKEGKLTAMAVLPSVFPMTDANRDVTGKEQVAVEDLSFDGTTLKFKVRQGEEIFEAEATMDGRNLKGTWKLSGSDGKGALYMHRRYR